MNGSAQIPAATGEGPTAQVPETNWNKAVRLAHELSAVLDDLSADGALMVEVHAAKSGHAGSLRILLPADGSGDRAGRDRVEPRHVGRR